MAELFGRGQVDGLPFLRILGEGEKVGHGLLYTYTVYVERPCRSRAHSFAAAVERTLADERGWIKSGRVAFQRVPKNGGTQLVLATPETVDKLCAPLETDGYVSCCMGHKVVINYQRWMYAVPHWPNLITYRQMLINHEFGHRIGQGHRVCTEGGKRAPVMQQQTYSLQGCRANAWPLRSELESV